jgi:hypothetical protein
MSHESEVISLTIPNHNKGLRRFNWYRPSFLTWFRVTHEEKWLRLWREGDCGHAARSLQRLTGVAVGTLIN